MDVNFLIFFLVQTTGFDYINYLLNYSSSFGELLVNPVTMCSVLPRPSCRGCLCSDHRVVEMPAGDAVRRCGYFCEMLAGTPRGP